jgi:uncharacterized repeat protein (TIGR03803 family)
MSHRRKCVSRVTLPIFLLFALASVSPSQTFTTLVNFAGTNGASPYAGLVQGINGDLYGTTLRGGAANLGTVFAMTLQGELKSLVSFDESNGANPYAPLMVYPNGTLYGTARSGGANNIGTLFRITPSGTLTKLFSFGTDGGADPLAGLVEAFNGLLYGATSVFGPNFDGSIFEITLGGTLTTVHDFGGVDGAYPAAAPVQAPNGLLYGTTVNGGAYSNNGVIYTLSLSGEFTTLYNFDYAVGGGSNPHGALVVGTDGNLYGTTEDGGAYNYGTVFQITPTGVLTTLHSFDYPDGSVPLDALVQGTDGNFYGTTSSGGTNNYGTIFQITPTGTLTTLYNFDQAGGGIPECALVQATDGNFYGTAEVGGLFDYGTVFRLSTGLSPFVKMLPSFGKVGASVTILGTDLTGATSVTFNGIPAAITGSQPTALTVTVPAGATSGTVQVTTPSGTLSSFPAFLVRP